MSTIAAAASTSPTRCTRLVCSCSRPTARITVDRRVERGQHARQREQAVCGWPAGRTCSPARRTRPASRTIASGRPRIRAVGRARPRERHDQQRRGDARDDQRPQARVVAGAGQEDEVEAEADAGQERQRQHPRRRSARAGGRSVGPADQHDGDQAEHDARTRRPARGRSPITTPTTTGTMAARTAVTGEITFIGATGHQAGT